jgi:DNA-binding transcriptional MerR regulator
MPASWRQEAIEVKQTYGISELAEEFDITTRTIRFYEEKGYLAPARDGTRLRLILRGKRLGLSLDETVEMIHMYGSPQGNRKQLETFVARIEEKRAELERKRRDLEIMLNDLQNVKEQCHVVLAQIR